MDLGLHGNRPCGARRHLVHAGISYVPDLKFRINVLTKAVLNEPLSARRKIQGKPVHDAGLSFQNLHLMAAHISKKRKFVRDGLFKAELNQLLWRQLAEDGYSGVEVRVTPSRTEIIIMATRTQNVLGEKGRRIRELTAMVQKRFGFEDGTVELYAEKVANRGLCASAQCESLRYKLHGGLAVRRACYGVLRFIMESGAKGCEVVVSGKLRGQRAKSMKFVDGLMKHSGNPVREYVDTAVRHVLLRQGVLGIKVKIMLPWDPNGKIGPKNPLPDHISIVEPKDEEEVSGPKSESKAPKPEAVPQQQAQQGMTQQQMQQPMPVVGSQMGDPSM